MDETQRALMMATREGMEWLLQWFEIATSGKSPAEQMRQLDPLRFGMMDRAVTAPALGAATALGGASSACELLMLLAERDPAAATKYVSDFRRQIDNM